ncbi:PTS sugar transporter subunit IIA [candidate division KSB1 bacterium]|nr:PTS sugar transporter subunit IIA [candidate division KSB1 bacterium]RQW06730.1 MAG: PTS sugar transporter subunit IIA [candidate division KSB1 bacterium]
MNLKDLLTTEVIKIPLESDEKFQIIEEMVDILNKAGRVQNRDMVLNAVMDRERIMSTGMGDGVAIPHAKTDGVKELVAAFGVTKQNIDFQSIDRKPVRIIFLLAGPTDQTGPHLKALSRISRLVHRKEFRDKLAAVHSADEVIEAISQEEQKYFAL